MFQRAGADFAVIINEYALVVGVITLNDVMSTVMGDLVVTQDELQIIDRGDGSWLVDGSTPIDDLEHALDVDEFPEDSTYETVAGFMMYMLRKIPKRTDKVTITVSTRSLSRRTQLKGRRRATPRMRLHQPAPNKIQGHNPLAGNPPLQGCATTTVTHPSFFSAHQ